MIGGCCVVVYLDLNVEAVVVSAREWYDEVGETLLHTHPFESNPILQGPLALVWDMSDRNASQIAVVHDSLGDRILGQVYVCAWAH